MFSKSLKSRAMGHVFAMVFRYFPGMDRSQYWMERLTICTGPDWEEQIFLRNEDGIGRPATSSELREAAQYLDWVRERLPEEAPR
jgi:hypothetical protein